MPTAVPVTNHFIQFDEPLSAEDTRVSAEPTATSLRDRHEAQSPHLERNAVAADVGYANRPAASLIRELPEPSIWTRCPFDGDDGDARRTVPATPRFCA